MEWMMDRGKDVGVRLALGATSCTQCVDKNLFYGCRD
jgi:hypothetical protein